MVPTSTDSTRVNANRATRFQGCLRRMRVEQVSPISMTWQAGGRAGRGGMHRWQVCAWCIVRAQCQLGVARTSSTGVWADKGPQVVTPLADQLWAHPLSSADLLPACRPSPRMLPSPVTGPMRL